ncbi:MAG: hypothetical protein JRE23_00085 [Deltaproteobacteria bacterium]|nr:hypothetical protein [Deltaproteobacteria bacterium]
MFKFEVRQQIKSVDKSWLQVIFESSIERPARMSYLKLVDDYPEEYFELVKVEHKEECLEFTPKL